VSKKFARATIHSHARLTYTEVQEVLDDEKSSHKMTNEIKLLYKVFEKLLKARINRGSLDLDIGEAKINLGEDGKIASITERPRRDAERLIEELMITANVAAAQVFSTKGLGVYRVHDTPTKEKVDTLRSTLGPMGFTVPSPEAGHRAWAKLVEELKKHPAGPQLMRAVLQTQQQAKYDAQNIGHYGLALPLYSHFTSPIRRYADLLVHRAIIKHLSLPGQGGHLAEGGAVLTRVCEGINLRERISQRAEWEAKDRLIVQYFSELLIKAEEEQIFDATVTGVQKYGMFISINGVAEGLLPVESLRENGYDYVPRFELYKKGQDKKKILRLASTVKVELADADQIRGRLTFRLISA
ncbi:MAG: ribonuclease R, partial [Alphaproteobacteria bacterium CG_4_10_14_0_8_um_filter_53_9]